MKKGRSAAAIVSFPFCVNRGEGRDGVLIIRVGGISLALPSLFVVRLAMWLRVT